MFKDPNNPNIPPSLFHSDPKSTEPEQLICQADYPKKHVQGSNVISSCEQREEFREQYKLEHPHMTAVAAVSMSYHLCTTVLYEFGIIMPLPDIYNIFCF